MIKEKKDYNKMQSKKVPSALTHNQNVPSETYIATVGRRKTSIARVRLQDGQGLITINNKEVKDIHPTIKEPLELTGLTKKVDVSVKVMGGGATGQIEAIRHGVSRALIKYNPETKTTLKKAGFLTRDPRAKERKKPGLKGARKSPQWSKR